VSVWRQTLLWLYRCDKYKTCPLYRVDSYTCNKEGNYFTSVYCGAYAKENDKKAVDDLLEQACDRDRKYFYQRIRDMLVEVQP